MTEPRFELWLEFEQWRGDGDRREETCDYFNAQVTLTDGRTYGLNVWTFDYVTRARQEAQESGECNGGRYLVAPDLLVECLDRGLVEDAVRDMLRQGELPAAWLVPSSAGGSGMRPS